MKDMTQFISLGGDCQPAQQIKHNRGCAKHFFDWIIVPIKTVQQLIESDFTGFGAAADLAPVYHGEHLHSVVESKHNVEFMHDFKTFDAAEIKNFQQKYKYLAEKFLALLSSDSGPVLFIRRWVDVDGPEDETKARKLYQTIQARKPGSYFLYLHNDESRARVIDGFYRSAFLPQSGADWEGDHAAWRELLTVFATQKASSSP
jgi:hypothetical protein